MSKAPGQAQLNIPQIKPPRSVLDMRASGRIDIRANEGVSAALVLDGREVELRVFDLSTSGVCVIGRRSDLEVYQPLAEVKIRVRVSKSESFLADYCVCWVTPDKQDEMRLGLRRIDKQTDLLKLVTEDLLITVAPTFPITGYLFKDLHYEERSIFRIRAISSKQAVIEVLDTENLFYPDKPVEFVVLSQSARSEKVKAKVGRIVSVTDSSITLEVLITSFPEELKTEITNCLVLSPRVTLEQLRASGFKVGRIAKSFRFRYVKTQEEYLEVLKLRLIAYKEAGKVNEGASLENVVAPLDHLSRILVALHGDKVIASVSLSFPESQDLVLDTEKALANGYPKGVPPKTEMIEVARLCTDPDYRRSDLLLKMFEHVYRVFATSGRSYLISSSDDKLWPIYKKLGFKRIGASYAHPYLKGLKHEIILLNIKVLTSGVSIGPLHWLYFYANMTSFLESKVWLTRSFTERAKFNIYKTISKVLNRFFFG